MNQNQYLKLRHSAKTRRNLILLTLFSIILYLLWSEYEAQLRALAPYLPYLFLLACPLMHIFMHRGHSHNNQPSPVQNNTTSSIIDEYKNQ